MVDWKSLTDDELLAEAGRGQGNEPQARWLGLIESNRRVIAAVNDLRAETAQSSRTIATLTKWLVLLTVVLVLVGIVTIWAAANANGS